MGAAIQKLVVDIANEKKVKINPRYGVWDAVNADVVPVDSGKCMGESRTNFP